MFYLEIGINSQHPAIPFVVDWSDIVEMRLKKRRLKPFNWMRAVTLRWPIEGPLKEGFVLERAKILLEAAHVQIEAIHHMHVWAHDVMMLGDDGNGTISLHVKQGGGNLYMSSSTLSNMRCTYIALHPFDWPHGLEHTVGAFEVYAREFVLAALVWKRMQDAAEQIEKHHNPKASLEKLRSGRGHMSSLLSFLPDECKYKIESKLIPEEPKVRM